MSTLMEISLNPPHNESKKIPDLVPHKNGHGCLRSCLLLFLVFVLGIGCILALVFQIPRKIGLTKSPAQKYLDDTPDRIGATKLLDAAAREGLRTKGIEIVLLPYKDGSGAIAYAIMDSSKGFQFNVKKGGDPFLGTLAQLVASQTAKELHVVRVAAEYHDEEGKTLVTLSAPTQSINDFSSGKITREQFTKSVDGQMNVKNVIERSIVSF